LADANRADVVFAFFGYNESFAGETGLAKFKKDLDDFIGTRSSSVTTASPRPDSCFSPIAHENLKSSDLPDGVRTTSGSPSIRPR
jgi:hypothetical protein